MRNPGNRVQQGSIVRGNGNSSIKPERALEGGSTMAANNARTLAPAWNDDQSELIGVLPREVGVLLIVAGVGGILLPGPVGSPFLLLGAVTLWPRLFTRLEPASRSGSRKCTARVPGRSIVSWPIWIGAIPCLTEPRRGGRERPRERSESSTRPHFVLLTYRDPRDSAFLGSFSSRIAVL